MEFFSQRFKLGLRLGGVDLVDGPRCGLLEAPESGEKVAMGVLNLCRRVKRFDVTSDVCNYREKLVEERRDGIPLLFQAQLWVSYDSPRVSKGLPPLIGVLKCGIQPLKVLLEGQFPAVAVAAGGQPAEREDNTGSDS